MNKPDYLERNREAWDKNADWYVTPGRENWGANEPSWGVWGIPESEVGLLPDVKGKDTVELGCGTGYVSAWLARRGARPVGLDLTPNQLASAAMFQREFDLHFPIIRAAAEQVPLRDESFDVAISEYGAALWSDPYLWIPEAARLLRPGGELIFLSASVLFMLCTPDDENEPVDSELLRPEFGIRRFEWPDTTEVEFQISHGDMIRLLRTNGFVIEDLIELRPAENATSRYKMAALEWSRQWPGEEAWKVRKT